MTPPIRHRASSNGSPEFLPEVSQDNLDAMTMEDYTRALKLFFRVGRDDARENQCDPSVKHASQAEDLVRAYIRGYNSEFPKE